MHFLALMAHKNKTAGIISTKKLNFTSKAKARRKSAAGGIIQCSGPMLNSAAQCAESITKTNWHFTPWTAQAPGCESRALKWMCSRF